MIYSGINEFSVRWAGKVKYFDLMGDEFDIKPKYNAPSVPLIFYTLSFLNVPSFLYISKIVTFYNIKHYYTCYFVPLSPFYNNKTVFLVCAHGLTISIKFDSFSMFWLAYTSLIMMPLAFTPTTPMKTHQIYEFSCLACAHGHTLDKPI